MTFVNALPSEEIGIVGTIAPIAATSSTTPSSEWISAAAFYRYLAVLEVGTIPSTGTVDCTVQQATDGSGANAKAFTASKAITQLTAGAGTRGHVALINIKQTDFDLANGFCFFQVQTNVLVATSPLACTIYGIDGMQNPAFLFNTAAVVQTVN